MKCDSCGKDISSWSAKYDANDTVFCKDCHGTDAAEEIIKQRAATRSKSPENVDTAETSKSPAHTVQQDTGDSYHFKTLLGYGKFISGLGWLTVVLGLIGILAGLSSSGDTGIIVAGAAFFGVLAGIGLVASGQLISCFVAIEENTRTTYELLKQKV